MINRILAGLVLLACTDVALATSISFSKDYDIGLDRSVLSQSVGGVNFITRTRRSRLTYDSFDPALGELRRVDVVVSSEFLLAADLADVIRRIPTIAGPIPIPFPYTYEMAFSQSVQGLGLLDDVTMGNWRIDFNGANPPIGALLSNYLFENSVAFADTTSVDSDIVHELGIPASFVLSLSGVVTGSLADFINLDGLSPTFDLDVNFGVRYRAIGGGAAGTLGGLICPPLGYPVAFCPGSGGARSSGSVTIRYTFDETTSVPEPTTILLLGFGIAGVGFARRRLH